MVEQNEYLKLRQNMAAQLTNIRALITPILEIDNTHFCGKFQNECEGPVTPNIELKLALDIIKAVKEEHLEVEKLRTETNVFRVDAKKIAETARIEMEKAEAELLALRLELEKFQNTEQKNQEGMALTKKSNTARIEKIKLDLLKEKEERDADLTELCSLAYEILEQFHDEAGKEHQLFFELSDLLSEQPVHSPEVVTKSIEILSLLKIIAEKNANEKLELSSSLEKLEEETKDKVLLDENTDEKHKDLIYSLAYEIREHIPDEDEDTHPLFLELSELLENSSEVSLITEKSLAVLALVETITENHLTEKADLLIAIEELEDELTNQKELVEKETNTAKDEIDKLQSEKADLLISLEGLEDDKNTAKTKFDDLQSEKNNLENAVEQKENEIKSIKDAEIKLKDVTSAEIDELQNKNNSMEKTIKQRNDEIEKLEDTNNKIKQDYDDYKNQQEEDVNARKETEAEFRKTTETELEKLQAENESLTKENRNLTRSCEEQEQRSKTLSDQMSNQRKLTAGITGELEQERLAREALLRKATVIDEEVQLPLNSNNEFIELKALLKEAQQAIIRAKKLQEERDTTDKNIISTLMGKIKKLEGK